MSTGTKLDWASENYFNISLYNFVNNFNDFEKGSLQKIKKKYNLIPTRNISDG